MTKEMLETLVKMLESWTNLLSIDGQNTKQTVKDLMLELKAKLEKNLEELGK